MSQFLWVLVVIATTITRQQQETMFGVMGGTPLSIRRDRRLHSVSKSLNLSPQRSYRPALVRTNCRPVQKQINAIYKPNFPRHYELNLRPATCYNGKSVGSKTSSSLLISPALRADSAGTCWIGRE